MSFAVPQHVAFIMDGNGRWATRQGQARLKGHAEGVKTVQRVLEQLGQLGTPFVTFYAFSTENWKRSPEEVQGLFAMAQQYFKSDLATMIKKGVRLKFIGDRSPEGKLPYTLRKLMDEAEKATAHNTKITAIFAVNYGAQDELARAAKKLAQQGVEPTVENLESALDTAGIPAPDLIIRTAGEQRLSNFLLWQAAYAELYFTEVLWPEFGSTHLQAALASFTQRTRRFGAVPASSVEQQPSPAQKSAA
jgi:undecaprenyl diphosphate synthase